MPPESSEAAAIHRFVDQLLNTGAVSDEEFDAVCSRFGKVGTIELIGIVGFYTSLAFVINVDRLPVEQDGNPWSLPPRRRD